MVTIVIDGSVTEEQIQKFIKENNIKDDYEILSKEEYEARIQVMTKTYLFSCPDIPVMEDITSDIENQIRKEKKFAKNQQKLAVKYSNRWK